MVEVDGRPARLPTRQTALRRGIGLIPQSGSLVAELNLIENYATTQQRLLLRPRQTAAVLRQAAAHVGVRIDLTTPAGKLGRAQQQLGEIVLAVAHGARVLLLDEPTSVLDPGEIGDLHHRIRDLAASGMAIVLITHRLAEVAAVADIATVLTHGRISWTGPVAESDPAVLAAAMAGDDDTAADPTATSPPRTAPATGAPVLDLAGAWATSDDQVPIRDVTLLVHPGEIVAVVGAAGSGQRALADAAAGVVPILRGRRRHHGPLAYVPDERRRALLPGLPAAYSAVLPQLANPQFTRRGRLRRDAVDATATTLFDRFDVRPRDPQLPAAAFSGGNAQKLIVGRELAAHPAIAILHAPTHGLDLRAAAAVRALITDTAATGTGVLLISADHDEARSLAHRVLTLTGGRICREYTADAWAREVRRRAETQQNKGLC
jgi:simple sugar transport system ATP-binding protein